MRLGINFASAFLAFSLALPVMGQAPAAANEDPGLDGVAAPLDLPLNGAQREVFEHALQQRDYKTAESMLVEEAKLDPKSPRTARLLAIAGGIFFLDAQYLNSVIAWKKSEAIQPLDERSRFTLAMAEVRLNRRDWARAELEKLAASQPQNPLFLYWLGRLDYDARHYEAAIARFQKVVELDPKMMRAYDNLGLCHDYVGKIDDAIADYQHAIALNRQQTHPSPWPPLNLAIALTEKNRLADADESLREAIRYDSRFAQAYYQLGRVLNRMNRDSEAVTTLKQAVTLDANYADPHYLLARIYRRMGQTQLAKSETDQFVRLKNATQTSLHPNAEP